jgi:hypothetical protein
MRFTLLPVLLLAAPLAACDHGEGTSITLNASDEDGNVVAGVDGATGRVAINVPGFKGSMTLPKIHLNADNFDMNGVHLYPGSKITTMNIDGRDGKDGSDADGIVRVAFESPADPATVRDWFKDKLSAAGFKLNAEGNGLTGTTDENKPFKLELQPADAGHAKGSITISG